MQVIFLILFSLFLISPVYAAVYYVSPSGLDSYTCSQAQNVATPKRTVASARGCVRAGDSIQMRGGTYDEGQILWFDGPSGTSWSAPITLENYPGERPVWNMPPSVNNWSQLVFRNTRYIMIRGITFDGTNGSNSLVRGGYTDVPVPGGYAFISLECNNDPIGCSEYFRIENNEMRYTAYGAIIGGNHIEIRNNHIHHISKVSNSLAIYNAGNDVVVEHNLFENIAGSAINYWSNDGSGANNGVARNNKIIRGGYFWAPTAENGNLPGTGGPRIAQGTYSNRSPGIFVSRGSNIQVYNNLIIDSAGGVMIRYNANSCRVHNNTIYGNGGVNPGIYIVDSSTTNCIISNNIVYGLTGGFPAIHNNVPSGGHVIMNNLTTNPGFVNPPTDLRPQSGSRAIDTGLNLSPLFKTDFAGAPRPQGDAWDIGAFEFTTGEPSNVTQSPTEVAVISVSPTSVSVHDTVTATWNSISAPTPTDWIGLYRVGAPDLPYQTNLLAWMYVSCSKTAATARSSGSCPFALPSTLSSGVYELRLFANDDFIVKLASASFTLTVSTPAPPVNVSVTIQ